MLDFLNTNITLSFSIAYALSQILVLISLVASSISTSGYRRQRLICMLTDSMALTLSYLILGSPGAAVANALCIVRYIVALLQEHYRFLDIPTIPTLFIVLHTILGLATGNFIGGPIECAIPIGASICSVMASFSTNETTAKKYTLLMFFLWLILDISLQNPMGIINNLIPTCSAFYNLICKPKTHFT